VVASNVYTRPVLSVMTIRTFFLQALSVRASLLCRLVAVSSLLAFYSTSQGQQPQPSLASIQSLIRTHRYDEALQAIDAQLKQTPGDVRLWTLDGITLSMQSKTQKAIDAFDHALKISPKYPAALKGAVELYYRTQDKRAIPLLEEIVTASPEDETAQEMLAVLDERQGHCQASLAHFALSTRAIAAHPGSLEAYGRCLMQQAEYQQAASIFAELAALLPDRSYPKYDLAVALVAAKRAAEALTVLTPLIATDPSDPEILSLASDAYEATGDTPKAVSLLREAIVLAPANAAYYTEFAALCLNHESFQVGIDMINLGLQRIAKDSSLYIARGMLYAQLAQYDQAEADFKTAELLDAGQSLSAYATDLAELQKNNPDSALAQIRAQLKVHPDSPLLLYLLAKLLSNQGADSDQKLFDEATRSATQALRFNPDMTEARDLLATMYTHSGQYGLAVEQCHLALHSNPDDQTAIYHLIIALRHVGQGDRHDEIHELVRRLAELQKASRQNETDRKRFRFEEQQSERQ